MSEKRNAGRPREGDEKKILTMQLVTRINSISQKSSADLQDELLGERPGAPGMYWNRFGRGERAMNSTERDRVFRKAQELGYLKTAISNLAGGDRSKFGYLTDGLCLEKAKIRSMAAKMNDRAAVKIVAEARSALRKVKELLEARENFEWSFSHSKYEIEVNSYDEAFECEISEISMDRYQMFNDLKTLDEVLASLRFDALSKPGDEWLKTI